jgi:hypothetical protein
MVNEHGIDAACANDLETAWIDDVEQRYVMYMAHLGGLGGITASF